MGKLNLVENPTIELYFSQKYLSTNKHRNSTFLLSYSYEISILIISEISILRCLRLQIFNEPLLILLFY